MKHKKKQKQNNLKPVLNGQQYEKKLSNDQL